jgi:hypothetical protein
MKNISILFPVFNYGQALLIAVAALLLTLIAIDDQLLALYLGTVAYLSNVIYMWLRGLAPDQVEIREDEIGQISDLLASARFIYPLGDCVWAPALSRSWLFRSDWISINKNEDGKFILKGRKRDLKIILSEIREGNSTL